MREAASLPRRVGRSAAFLLVTALTARLAWGQEVLTNSSKECAICHIRWVQALDRRDLQNNTMQAAMERQTGSGDMCLSCHDGSVVDSRFKVWSTRHHTTDAAPSPAVHIPTEKFPLDAQGHVTCATCHTARLRSAHGDLPASAQRRFLALPRLPSAACPKERLPASSWPCQIPNTQGDSGCGRQDLTGGTRDLLPDLS